MNSMEYFCSETCFVSSRRTVFKQTKICDWCRHIKNPTNYIDLQVNKILNYKTKKNKIT